MHGFPVPEDMMKNNKHLSLPFAMACSAVLTMLAADASPGGDADADILGSFEDRRYTHPRYEVLQILNSKCRRNTVVWSGGIALRFSDRISPRPTRSRWDRDPVDPVHCKEVDAFKQLRVADQPMIR
jgi:hypothetical protein